VSGTATGLLALVGVETDPVQSREHILVSTLLTRAWQQGQDLDLGSLIAQVEEPPLERVGAMELDKFFPQKARAALALKLNGLLAAPGFSAWLEGEPLDPATLLRGPDGRPRVSVISIAHLSEAERMFFVTLLLGEVVAWMRSQTGTSSLRAILYMDEIFGYFPPVAEPPSKRPLLTLLKQARAYGLGIVLATQNPVDLDYKGLANAGTWFIGRLQTERDKARLVDGLEGASAAADAAFDRTSIESTIGRLAKRVFLMNNVHEDAPVLFESRWAMSYLRGPLTRQQIGKLMEGRRPAAAAATAAPAAPTALPVPGAGPVPVVDPAAVDLKRREERDAAVEKLRTRYAPKLRGAQEKVRNAAQVVERESGQAQGAKVQTAVSIGATVLGALFGRKLGTGTIGRGTTAARGAARAMEQQQDVERAKEDLEAAEQQLARLEEELQAEIATVIAGA
ncbi:MAG: ATP-binding protein, partial [Chloroflexota bacterium]|nr:ATP-binding protein [Chloroflexota bacterium]